MARKKVKRPVESYLTTARALAKYVPSLRKYKKRKTLKLGQKSAIARRENQLKGIPLGSLYPVTKKQARKLKGKLFLPGIRAVQLRQVPEGSKVTFRGPDIFVTEPGNQKWVYWSLDRDTVRTRRGMRKAGADAFAKKFPIELVADLTAKAFASMNVQQVRLWAHAGKVGDTFHDIETFIRWVNEKWSQGRYMSSPEGTAGEMFYNPSDPGKWVNGIAILLENPDFAKRRQALSRDYEDDGEEFEE